MEKGRMIGKGRTAEVYEWGPDRVIKLYNRHIPREWMDNEYQIARRLNEAGTPAPQACGLAETEGRTGIVYEKVSGRSLLQTMRKNPLSIKKPAYQMARAHWRIHQTGSGRLITTKQRLQEAVLRSKHLLAGDYVRIQERIARMPESDTVCHGDFHPDNLMDNGKELVAIDWMNAGRGDSAADVMRTLLMIESPSVPPGLSGPMLFLLKISRKRLKKYYLRRYLKLSGMKTQDIEYWRAAVAAARLCENIPGERRWLLEMIRAVTEQPGSFAQK